jgi:hypothetical protein
MEDELKTSAEWYEIHKEKEGHLIIMDPDGWDRANYNHSFNEEMVTQKEFNMRLMMSTVLIQRNEDGTAKI